MVPKSTLWFLLTLLPILGCINQDSPPITFEPSPFEAPDALPGFASSSIVTLTNNTGTTYQLTGLSFSSEDGEADQMFQVSLPEEVSLPLELAGEESLELTVVFSPETLTRYDAALTAQLWLLDFEIGGGGCSGGCGREAPEDVELFVVLPVAGTGTEDALFEDCTNGEDDDDDGLVDCEDPDCATHDSCADNAEICNDGIDNDEDGLVDCLDEDCADHPDCVGPSEDCVDGIDNDSDGAIDCDDDDCMLHPDCATVVGCQVTGDLLCGDTLSNDTSIAENTWDSYCDSSGNGWTGPEDVWALFMEDSVEVTVRAIREGEWDLDMTILEGVLVEDEVLCDPRSCVGNSWNPPLTPTEEVTFEADAGKLYFIVVDGWEGARGPYDLALVCNTNDEETDCDDTIDNDEDGDIDCADADCAIAPNCVEPGYCGVADIADCPTQTISSANSAAGSTSTIVDWCDEGFDLWTGPEVVFEFTTPVTQEITVSIDELTADLDLTVLLGDTFGAPEEVCNPQFCVDENWGPNAEPEEITFEAFDGTTYFFAVDGWDGAVSDFELTVTCTQDVAETECDDGLDNDGDGNADCDDIDCSFSPPCLGDPEICDDGLDNDNDGAVDCDDSECAGDPLCQTEPEICDDGEDNDSDGDIDCDDADCSTEPLCLAAPEVCDDSADNDLDGDVDCEDLEDCLSFPGCDYGDGDCCTNNGTPGCDNDLGEDCVCALDEFCCTTIWDPVCVNLYTDECGASCGGPEVETDCTDGLDDDLDGLIDCLDADCGLQPVCQPESDCGDSLDNDSDGDTDCSDSDCAVAALCQPESACDDEVDNDEDGATDCDDSDCSSFPDCLPPSPEICDDGLDNDEDGDTDCDDIDDCAVFPACQPPGDEDCDDGVDNDSDGDLDCDDSDCVFDPICDTGDGTCCINNGSPGCDDEPGEDCVCALDAFCCTGFWDDVCATLYSDQCGGSCTGEDCGNTLDDDGDGQVDCDDSDCLLEPSCIPLTEVDCSDTLDNDNDGATDCEDTDCDSAPECAPPDPEVDCGDLVDNDADGLIDCADDDCADDDLCNIPGTETNCANGVDDDADGTTDCEDIDCVADPNCNIFTFEADCSDAVDNDGDGDTDCDDSDCISFPGCLLPAETDCDNGVDDDADSRTDCADPDCSSDPACATSEDECSDGLDNDGDSLIDCDDNDCSTSVDCVDAGNCDPIGNITCGDVITGANNMPGSNDDQDEYCDMPLPPGWNGPEVAWVLSTPFDANVEVTLFGLTDDLDITVLDHDNGCDESDCLAQGWNPPPDAEFMDIFATAGQPYYVVIDGWANAVSNFTMEVECVPVVEQDCSDGLDDDEDGSTDCEDTDCLGSADCPELDCTDGIDNDADSFADCSDPDCFSTPTCLPELNCVNGADDDLDGDVDCEDSDCGSAPVCQPETACGDGLDNDADGDLDCDDDDCLATSECGECLPVVEELTCGDVHTGTNLGGPSDIDSYCGAANDFSGPEQSFSITSTTSQTVTLDLVGLVDDLDLFVLLTDPAGGCLPDNCVANDSQSGSTAEQVSFAAAAGSETLVTVDGFQGATSAFALSVSCSPTAGVEVCDDGLDNDMDGDEDCFDSDCSGTPGCSTETECEDGFDNDADQLADCNDPDCFGSPGCPVIIFSSVDDDPSDFAAVQLGSHDASLDWEQGTPDTSAQSGDGPSTGHSGTLAWCTGCEEPALTGGRFNSYLVAQPEGGGAPGVIDLSGFTTGSLTLSWFYWQQSPGIPFVDLATLQVSTDGGLTPSAVWGPQTADTNGWTYVEQDFSDFLGEQLTFAFRYDTLFGFGGDDNDGLYVDDVVLTWEP